MELGRFQFWIFLGGISVSSAIGVAVGGRWGAALEALSLLFLLGLAWTFRRSFSLIGRGSGGRLPADRLPDLSTGEPPQSADKAEQDPIGLAARIREITAERNRLENTLASIVEGVVAIDQAGRTIQMNGAAARFLHANVSTVLGLPFTEVCRSLEIAELVRLTLTTHRFQKRETDDGGIILDCYAGPLSEGGGAVLVLHDITEVRRLESVRRDFVANVSHELKTPLTAIKGYVETLIEGGLDDRENNLRFLRKVETHANRLTTLITDLLSLSRIESGEAVSKREQVVVAEVLSASLIRLAPGAERKGIRFGGRHIDRSLQILGDMEALNQIFDNLIDNAIKYTEPGGRVEVSLYQKDGKVMFDVEDSGVGIPAEDIPRIFERFYRVDKARSRELGGTGLGLSIVRHLAHALQGDVRVRSKLGAGSVFSVLLPAYTPEKDAVERGESPDR